MIFHFLQLLCDLYINASSPKDVSHEISLLGDLNCIQCKSCSHRTNRIRGFLMITNLRKFAKEHINVDDVIAFLSYRQLIREEKTKRL